MENPESLNRIDSQNNKDNDDIVDIYIELKTNVVKNTELSTSELVARKISETPDENVYTEEEISVEQLTIPGDYSDDDILEEEKETISKNDEVWTKTQKEIWRGMVLLIPCSKKEDSAHLKIKWSYSGKEDRVLIKNVLLNY